MKRALKSENDTKKFAYEVATGVRKGGLICLIGELGTGKTTFTKYLCESLGAHKNEIKSPTYTYIQKYETPEFKIFHIDLYRLEGMDELLIKEIEEILADLGSIVIIEWADRMLEFLPEKRFEIYFEFIGKDERTAEIKQK